MKSSIIFFVLLIWVAGSANDDDQQPRQEQQQWNNWFQERLGKLHHHKKNVERALSHVKVALQKNSPASHHAAWNRPDARIAKSCATEEASAVQVRETSHELVQHEPFVGMILQVFDKDNTDTEVETVVPPCSGESTSIQMYELLEPVQLDLGVVPKHLYDYAYAPVAAGLSQDEKTGVSVKQEPMLPVATSMWWQWWLTIMGGSSKTRENTQYERVGERAFAGGSHGEVWRGRRKCHAESECDDKTLLILKRLKIEHGIPVMEAGLREVYVGNLLAREADAERLFTRYVDHFFRQIPRPSFLGRGSSKEHELWIVFEDAGPSLRSYLYTAVPSGDFVLHQQSPFWTALRLNAANITQSKSNDTCLAVPTKQWGKPTIDQRPQQDVPPQNTTPQNQTVARPLLREILGQILSSAAYLHKCGIVHRDIKPSNVMCSADFDDLCSDITQIDPSKVQCRLGDFSSAWDSFTDRNLYSNGPSANEQTPEYAPPEALPGPSWVPFHRLKPEVYDSWSIGVLALELLLGTPQVFSVDQRTTALLTSKMQKRGASHEEIQRALYLAALSQFCIYMPIPVQSWPLGAGDPLFNAAMVKQSCTLKDFHQALRARDPLGIGFDSRDDLLLHLAWQLLAWDPLERLTASEALQHPYFTTADSETKDDPVAGNHNAIESLALDPRMDIRNDETITEFTCPKCGRTFGDWMSCRTHATSRKHAKFCTYDRSSLPTCLNAHSMLPAHPTSGYCDIQGRRRTIEDFHSIQLHPSHQFYGIFDGHTGNLASKYAASHTYKEVSKRLSNIDHDITHNANWRTDVQSNLTEAFSNIHEDFLQALASSPIGVMDQSGTTATVVYVTDDAVIVASLGDSRAILSSKRLVGDATAMSAVQLTVDHVASDPSERKQVEKRGGEVTSSSGLLRVNGTLAITRSIGDDRLSPLLSREPHVIAMTRQDVKDECGLSILDGLPCFLVLASDGLWDVVTNQEAVDMVAQVVESHDTKNGTSWEEGGAFQEAAEVLTQEAYVRGSTDNIGVCVIAID